MNNKTSAVLTSWVLVGAAALAWVQTQGDRAPLANAGSDLVLAEGDQLLPSETPRDWATYADALVRVHVEAEQQLPPTEEEVAAGEGFMDRVVTADVVETYWTRDGAQVPPAVLHLVIDGWTFTDGVTTPLRVSGEAMLTIGKDYVMPIVHLSAGPMNPNGGWCELSPDSIAPLQADSVGSNDGVAGGLEMASPVLQDAWGGSPESLAQTLEEAPVERAAKKFMDLSAVQRFRAAERTTQSTGMRHNG